MQLKNLKELDLDDEKKHWSKYNNTIASKVLHECPTDSDDDAEDFTSEKWGVGASKIVAEHYNNLHKDTKGKPKSKLTQAQFQERLEQVKAAQV